MGTVVFDLDGTLADTSADLISAANARFRALGLGDQLDPVADQLTAFGGGRAMLRKGFERSGRAWDEDMVSAEYSPFLAQYRDCLADETRLYDGCEEALETLADAGYRLSICTNKPVDLAEDLMTRLGVRDRFGALIGAGSLPVRKPEPEPVWAAIDLVGGDRRRAILVGDTATDRNAARAAGVISLLVSFGPEGPGISRLEPDAMLPCYADLPWTVGQLIG